MKFDKDIQIDYDEGNIYSLAMVAQDLRNTMGHVAPRAMLAAIKRKQAKEKKVSDQKAKEKDK